MKKKTKQAGIATPSPDDANEEATTGAVHSTIKAKHSSLVNPELELGGDAMDNLQEADEVLLPRGRESNAVDPNRHTALPAAGEVEDSDDDFETMNVPENVNNAFRKDQAESNKIDLAQAPNSSSNVFRQARYNDAQAGASKVLWDSQDFHLESQESNTTEISQDRGFTENSQSRLQGKRPANAALGAADRQSPKRQRSNPPESRVGTISSSTLSQAGMFSTAREIAKENTMAAGPKAPQKRTPWSTAEEGTLMDLMRLHGCSWTNIQKMDRGGILVKRSQVQLKDKARNMKVSFLR